MGMPKQVMACFKWVYDEADIGVKEDSTPDFGRAKSKISEYDRSAVAAAVDLARALGAVPAGLTLGAASATAALNDALARGLEEAHLVDCGAEAPSDYRVVTLALAKVISTIPEVAAVVCAEGSSDSYGRQTAPRLGTVLGWPVVTAAISIKPEGSALLVRRKLEEGFETVRAPLPAVVAVLPEISRPDLPGMKAIIGAKKKPRRTVPFAELGVDPSPLVAVANRRGYEAHRKQILFDDTDDSANVKNFIEALRKEGVL
jgi:electron transfer flavoprotein beta subunit